MKIPTEQIKELREHSGAGIMECRNALLEAEGGLEKALKILKRQDLVKVEKKRTRATLQGLVEAYIHTGGRIGAMIELNCETDFVARTDEFKELAHELAMQVAACPPQFISPEEAPEEADLEVQTDYLLLQPYIRDQSITVQNLIDSTIAKVGENIQISSFARFEIGA